MPDPKQKKIAGQTFEVSQPYAEGHTITAIEAKVLNQVRSENIGNNVRKRVQELLEAGDTAGAEAHVREKDAEYVFTEAAAGGSSRLMDPVEREARKIARASIQNALSQQGKKMKDYSKEQIEEAVAKAAENPDIVKAAEKAVKDRQKVVEASASSLGLG